MLFLSSYLDYLEASSAINVFANLAFTFSMLNLASIIKIVCKGRSAKEY